LDGTGRDYVFFVDEAKSDEGVSDLYAGLPLLYCGELGLLLGEASAVDENEGQGHAHGAGGLGRGCNGELPEASSSDGVEAAVAAKPTALHGDANLARGEMALGEPTATVCVTALNGF
jgi:hypothetical protein